MPLAGDAGDEQLVGALPAHARSLPDVTPVQRQRREANAAAHLLCARALGRAPDRLSWTRTDAGRPVLVDAPGWRASLSHSDGVAAVALCHGALAGIDVEARDRLMRLSDLANAVLAPTELREWLRVPAAERLEAFLRFWTRKEAILKALGVGLAGELRSVVTSLDGRLCALPPGAGDPSGWALVEPPVPEGGVAALAVQTRAPVVTVERVELGALLDAVRA